MPHLVRGASQLIEQVTAMRPKVAVSPVGPVDGLRRLRRVEFDARTSKWLKPILEACDDPRIEALTMSDKKRLTVKFVDTVKADERGPFPLGVADHVLNKKD